MATRWPIFAKNKLMEQSRDILFGAAEKFIIANKSASESALQLYFGIGYYRAEMIMSELEEAGLVGPPMTFSVRRRFTITFMIPRGAVGASISGGGIPIHGPRSLSGAMNLGSSSTRRTG